MFIAYTIVESNLSIGGIYGTNDIWNDFFNVILDYIS